MYIVTICYGYDDVPGYHHDVNSARNAIYSYSSNSLPQFYFHPTDNPLTLKAVLNWLPSRLMLRQRVICPSSEFCRGGF